MINERDQQQVRNVMSYARKQGLDAVKLLDTYDLLLTTTSRHRISLDALRELQASLGQLQAHQIARRIRWDAPVTAAEMFDAIASYLDDYITMKEKEAT